MSAVTTELPRVLCVDDEPRVLDGLKLSLRRGFDVTTATSGAEGLAILKEKGSVAVVVSDMRMPAMDGAVFLGKVRVGWPDATRVLLTGETGRDAAINAVNEGQIFRFLTKPCAPDRLVAAVDAAVRQHQLVTAEKQLLQETVLGSIRALVDLLSIVNPIAFGRGGRIKRLANEVAAAAGLAPSWELEAAALMSQVGYVSLPLELVEKAVSGERLTADEAQLVGDTPKVTQGVLARIPRLENVARLLAYATQTARPAQGLPADLSDIGSVLLCVMEFDALTCRGENSETALATLRGRLGTPHAKALAQLAQLCGMSEAAPQVREMRLRDVLPGMILMDELRTDSGTLLVSRGYEVSQSFVERMRNFGPGLLAEKVRVQVGKSTALKTAS